MIPWEMFVCENDLHQQFITSVLVLWCYGTGTFKSGPGRDKLL
jgi:hypothetical protein